MKQTTTKKQNNKLKQLPLKQTRYAGYCIIAMHPRPNNLRILKMLYNMYTFILNN